MLRNALICVAMLAQFTGAAHAAESTGMWMTRDGESRIKIAPCGPKLCGTLAWLSEPNDASGQPMRDVNNADAALRGRLLIGVPLLLGLTKEGERWVGKIYNPDDGKTYDGSFSLKETGRAEIQGCVALVFCQIEVLIRQ